MTDWLTVSASWVQAVGSVLGIWYAARIASSTDRRQVDRTWGAAVVYGDQLVQVLSKLRDACQKRNKDWLLRFPYVLDDLIELGKSVSLEMLPRHNGLIWYCDLRRVTAEAKAQLEPVLAAIKGGSKPNYASAALGFNRLLNEAQHPKGMLTIVGSKRSHRKTMLQRIQGLADRIRARPAGSEEPAEPSPRMRS